MHPGWNDDLLRAGKNSTEKQFEMPFQKRREGMLLGISVGKDMELMRARRLRKGEEKVGERLKNSSSSI